MSLHKHRTLPKRSGFLPASGSVVESDPTSTATELAQDSAAVTGSNSNPTGVPLVASYTLSQSSISVSTASASSSPVPSSGQISLGTVIGACIGALVALLLAVAFAYYCSKYQKRTPAHSGSRNATNNTSRRRSHLEAWKRIDDDGGDRLDSQEGRDRPMRQRPPSGPLGAMFYRTTSNTSVDRSLEGHNRESVGTMQHFAKYHPCLAAEMASQGIPNGTDGEVAKPQPVLRLAGRDMDMNPPISWDGETIGEDSVLSGFSKSTQMMATVKSTPPAVTTSLHRWERAEVLHVSELDTDVSDVREQRNPFSDSASSIKSTTRGRNPFFSAQDHPVKRPLLPNPHKDPFADANAPRDSSTAIRSLIAALEEPYPPADSNRVPSFQSSMYSRTTVDDGDSVISATAFPYPPTQPLSPR